jgi:hypothetical protein
MSDNSNDDGFDSVVNGEENNEAPDFDGIMEVLAHYWKQFYPGHIFVKGVLVVESVTAEGRAISLETSSPICDWEILGLTDWAQSRVRADINVSAWVEAMGGVEIDEDEEEVEDEQ